MALNELGELGILGPAGRQTTKEIVGTALLLAGRAEGRTVEPPADPRVEAWHGELEALDTTLGSSLDPDIRQIKTDAAMEQFAPGGALSFAAKSAKEESKRNYLAELNAESGEALYAQEVWLGQHEGAILAAVEQMKQHPDPAAAAAAEGYDVMQSSIFVELRRGRREQFLAHASASARNSVYSDNPTTLEQLVDNAIIEELHAEGRGPATTDPRELHAAPVLRRRIERAKEDRVPQRAKELLARVAEARKACARARTLNKIHPAPPPERALRLTRERGLIRPKK